MMDDCDVLLTTLIHRLRVRGSWCGSPHIQRAVYLSEFVFGLPFPFDYVLYVYGPFSFDLMDKLAMMCEDGLLTLEPVPSFVPRFSVPDSRINEINGNCPQEYLDVIDFVSSFVCNKGMHDLVKLATAVHVRLVLGGSAQELCSVLPFVTLEEARSVFEEVSRLIEFRDHIR